jgi:EAL domain-containing protein (putative c-di-GMP-specific phosphodiesterase class I)
VDSIPLIGVGFFGVLNNPCMNTAEILSQGLDASKQMAMSQQKRGRERQRELMHSLIQSEELLTPNYQGVFRLQEISKEDMDEVKDSSSIAPIASSIYGFESLIRVNQDEVSKQNVCSSGVDSKYLRPDVMFSLAKNTKVALELDQACMRHAAKYAKGLPGCLMINILPRNLYHIDKLKEQFSSLDSVIFEVSESEAINNFDLMLKAKESLKKSNMGIAADDFGKGYSSIERVIKIRPNVIKFDRSMITDIHKDPIKRVYVKGLVEAAEILEAEVLVEGVELWEEAAVLKEMGVSLVQGFLFHRPQPVGLIKKQLEEAEKAEKEKPNLNVAS